MKADFMTAEHADLILAIITNHFPVLPADASTREGVTLEPGDPQPSTAENKESKINL